MSTVSEIKEKIDIIDIIGKYVDLKPAGSNYKALCPFHQEKQLLFLSRRKGSFSNVSAVVNQVMSLSF